MCFEGIWKVFCLSVRTLKSNVRHRHIHIFMAFYSQGISTFSYNRTSSALCNFQGISWIEKSTMNISIKKILFIVQNILVDTIRKSSFFHLALPQTSVLLITDLLGVDFSKLNSYISAPEIIS